MTITVNGKTVTKEAHHWIKTTLKLAKNFYLDGRRIDGRQARKEIYKRKRFDTHRYENRRGEVCLDVMI